MANNELYKDNQIFSKNELIEILDNAKGKTLGEVDVKNVFDRTKYNPKITGIAGDVIEESVLGYGSDTKQAPDILVDGIDTEVKTTGLKRTSTNEMEFEAKEPMSITAVSPYNIINEDFYNSHFWKKLNRMLIIYYLYDSKNTVIASEYANFPIITYHFNEIDKDDEEILKSDWELVQNLVKEIFISYENPEDGFPLISSAIRKQLMFINTAPKWPNRPRFRLKRSYVTTMYQKAKGKKFVELPENYKSYQEIDEKLKKVSSKYKGMRIKDIIEELNIPVKLINGDVNKRISEMITCKMFGSDAKKMSKIELFSEIGLKLKTITQTTTKKRTEDIKFHPIDFDEISDININFLDSTFYRDFSENSYLFIIFEEPNSKAPLIENKFLGFKRLVLSEEFLHSDVESTWIDLRNKIINKELKEEIVFNKQGKAIINKNGTVRTKINFPKSANFNVFLRGTGSNSNDKPLEINGIKMYRQNVWIKGSLIVELLNKEDFI